MGILAVVRQRPLFAYFALTFAISWGGILVVVAPGGIPGTAEQTERLFPAVFLAMLAGPSLAGMLLTGLIHGRPGLRRLLSRITGWRAGARWYAVALLAAPLAVLPTLLALSLASPVFLPGIFTVDDKASLLLPGIAVGLMAGFFEELGWTGFAVPALRSRCGVLATGLIVGAFWGLWHVLAIFWGSGGPNGELSLDLLLPPPFFFVGVLPAYRVLMVWVYDRTGSLPVAMLMHSGLTACTVFILAPAAKGTALVAYYLALTAVLWVVIAALRRRMASGGTGA